jgi:hypothetical protein
MKKIFTLYLLAPTLLFAQDIKLPAGFSISEIGKELGATRHITVSKQGHVYAKLSKLKEILWNPNLIDTERCKMLLSQMSKSRVKSLKQI